MFGVFLYLERGIYEKTTNCSYADFIVRYGIVNNKKNGYNVFVNILILTKVNKKSKDDKE